ncbi:MAG: hypothetical protein MN733_37225, partial [Nitrososphaera sp.]|nr:hypothetical protein [Nitrososphaera sp.]
AYMSGVACVMVGQIHQGKILSFRDGLINPNVRFGRLFSLLFLTWIAVSSLSKLASYLPFPETARLALTFGGALFIQVVFSYALAASIFEGSIWRNALLQGMQRALRYPLSSIAVVGIPFAAVFLFSLLVPPPRVTQWMLQRTPEIALAIAATQLFVWTVADALMTVGIAHLWWIHPRTRSPLSFPKKGIVVSKLLAHTRVG